MIGFPGKCPVRYHSSSRTRLRATTRAPGSISVTSSSRRNGSRCGQNRLDARPGRVPVTARLAGPAAAREPIAVPRARRGGARARDERSTSPCRPACSPRARCPRRRSPSRRAGQRQSAGRAAASRGRGRGPAARRRGCSRSPGRMSSPARASSLAAAARSERSRVRSWKSRHVLVVEPVEPRRELRVAAELAQPRAELHERLLRRVARVLDVAHELRGDPVHARRVALDEHVQRRPVARARLRDEREVAELAVGLEDRNGHAFLGQTEGGKTWLHGRK